GKQMYSLMSVDGSLMLVSVSVLVLESSLVLVLGSVRVRVQESSSGDYSSVDLSI
ncbi:hypothetical protein FRC18_002710, partial [Serendipita sp. 400]